MGDVITAMKKYLLIDKHFQDMEEDQFDSHKSNPKPYFLGAVRG